MTFAGDSRPAASGADKTEASPSRLRILIVATIRTACAALLLYWAFSRIDLTRVLESLSPRLMAAIAVGALLITSTAWLQAWRWQGISTAMGIALNASTALRATLTSYFLLAVTPSTIVADAARVMATKRAGENWSNAAQCVIVDRAFGLMAVLLLGLCGIPIMAVASPDLVFLFAVPIMTLFLAALAVVLLMSSRVPSRMLEFRIVRKWAGIVASTRAAIADANVMIPAAAKSILIVLLSLGAFWIVVQGAEARADLSATLVVFPFALLVSILPVSIGGWGAREVSLITLYPYFGTPAEDAMVVSLAFGLATLIAGLLSLFLLGLDRFASRPRA